MACKDIVVVGASAGGMDALQKLVAELPRDLPAAVFVVWHLSPGVRSVLPEVLERAGVLPVMHPEDGDAIRTGHVYVAPPDHHLLLERGYIRVTKGPKENRFRPAIDPLFRSAAYVYGPRSVGVVLSGALDDGTAGLWAIKLRGGTTIVQDPAEALHRSMPLSALENVEVDHRLAASEIGALIARLAREPAQPGVELPARQRELFERELRIAQGHNDLNESVFHLAGPSPFTCPDCHGVLSELKDGRIVRYRCHTGHAFSDAAILEATAEQVEARLLDAARLLDETVMMLNRMGQQFSESGNLAAAERCFDMAREAHERSQPIRRAALGHAQPPVDAVKATSS